MTWLWIRHPRHWRARSHRLSRMWIWAGRLRRSAPRGSPWQTLTICGPAVQIRRWRTMATCWSVFRTGACAARRNSTAIRSCCKARPSAAWRRLLRYRSRRHRWPRTRLRRLPLLPAPQAAQAQSGGLLRGLRDLLDGGKSKRENTTVNWLQKQGYDEETARAINSQPQLLQRVVLDAMGPKKSSEYEERFNIGKQMGLDNKALTQFVLYDKPPEGSDWTMETIYDANGREQKVLMNKNDPSQYRAIGGAKTDLMSPDAEAQKSRIAAAGKTDINMGGEKAYDQKVGAGYGDRFIGLQNDAQSAQRTLNALSVMEQAMNQPGFYSGPASGIVTYGKRLAASLGLDPNGVKDAESFNAMSKSAALDMMGGSLGSGFSNADRDFVLEQVPNLANSPEGNSQLIKVQKALAQRKQEIAQLARQYASQNGDRIDTGFDDYLSAWSEKNPLFPPGFLGDRDRVNNPPKPGATPPPRARNQQTGETIELRNGQWVPVQ